VSLGKAQECFLLKSIHDGIKSSLIARIAKQACEFFRDAENSIGSSAFSDVQSGFVSAKKLHLEAVAFHYAGKVSEEASRFGEELGYYEEADRSIKKALGLNKLEKGLVDEIKVLADTISTSIKR
jgi:hypothetical protein